MIANVKDLEVRIHTAKRFLNNELTQVKSNPGATNFTLSEIGTLKDSIHEVERRGLRNLSDTEFIKIRRVLTSLEARMRLSAN